MKLELYFEMTRDEHGVFDGRALAEHMDGLPIACPLRRRLPRLRR
jgi:hypothetical protein